EITHEEYCQLLTSLYYPLFAYKFEPTDAPESFYDLMVNGDIIVYLCDSTLAKPMIEPSIEENQIFMEIVKLIDQALELIKNIDSLKMDLGYLASWPLKEYLSKNVVVMAMRAGNEMTLYGGTKIEALYAVIFGEDSGLYNKVTDLTKDYTLDLYRDLNEEYLGMVKDTFKPNKAYSVFKNPSQKEIKEACDNITNSCRFVIDVESKDLYIWDWQTLHEQVSDWLGDNGVFTIYPCFTGQFLWGTAKFDSGKLDIRTIQIGLQSQAGFKALLKQTSFTNRWFGDSLSSRLKKQIKKSDELNSTSLSIYH
ncbi:hypothetical protein M0R04_16370, partial [Candidatus Dojkabacteria bacterium]|nr:hypothetical protein [Candidatus Dojkabacteria bacterium]